jgi:hypothetical protein
VNRLQIRTLALVVLLLSASATASEAQTAVPPAGEAENVIVTGQPGDPPSLQTEISRFVRGHARLSRIGQLARWRDPICVRVMNLPAEFSDFIADRIIHVAREAGAPTANAGCVPNATIIFSSEPQAVIDQVRSDNPALLGYHFIGQRDAVATMSRPIQAWYVTATANQRPSMVQFGGVGTFIDEAGRDPPPSTPPGSRLSNGLQSVIIHVLVVVDANEVADAPVGPIADYLAVLSLTEIRDESWVCGGLITIMEHFSDCVAAPETLTTADRAFLRGLYTMDEWALGSLQRGHIRGQMVPELRDDPPAGGQDPSN